MEVCCHLKFKNKYFESVIYYHCLRVDIILRTIEALLPFPTKYLNFYKIIGFVLDYFFYILLLDEIMLLLLDIMF